MSSKSVSASRPQGSALPLKEPVPLGRAIAPYLWLLPATAIMAAVLLYPWFWSLLLSFQKWSPLSPEEPIFIGLSNYLFVLQDPEFRHALVNTIVFVSVSVGVEFVVGFGLALLLNREPRGRAFFLTACLIPLMLTPAIVGMNWRMLLHDQWGVVPWFLNALGLPRIGWLSDPSWTLATIIGVHAWQHVPFVLLIMLAGLQSVPQDLLEAARVDGASASQSFWHVVLPWLRPLILIVLLFRIIFALRAFDVIFAMFRSGGPANAGTVLGVYLYEYMRVTWSLGTASAIAYVLLLITLLVGGWFAVRAFWGREAETAAA